MTLASHALAFLAGAACAWVAIVVRGLDWGGVMGRKTSKSAEGKARHVEAVEAIAARKQQGERAHPQGALGIVAPPPEQIGAFELQVVRTERGQVAGRAYRRQPYFETLAKQPAVKANPGGPRMISRRGLAALRLYRSIYEHGEASRTHCALDVDGRGGGTPGSRIPASIMTDHRLHACDAAMGALVDTMRAVALRDMTFSDVAIERFGGRTQEWIIVKEPVMKPDGKQLVIVGVGPQWRTYQLENIVPRSGRHREIVREEFLAALSLLIDATD